MYETLTLDDVILEPQYSEIKSRSHPDISNDLGVKGGNRLINFKLPLISSPMDTVTEDEMCTAMAQAGGLGILHRYNTIQEQIDIVNKTKHRCGAAVGVTGDYLERTSELVFNGVEIICLDVAHGHHILVKEAIQKLRKAHGDTIHIMAGNVATAKGYLDLANWGADSVRVGIGGGCFVPGTMVRTKNGNKPIEEIIIGDEVYTHTGEIHKVVDTLRFERNEEIMEINGIECTKNHEFYVVEKNEADKVNESNISSYAKWIHAEDLDMDRYLLVELE